MPTPSGTISLSHVNTELGYSSNAQISMNDSAVRELAGVGAGATISMNNLRNQSSLNSPPWYIVITGDAAANPWNAGGVIIDEVTTQAGNVLSVLPNGNPVSASGGKKVFSLQNPSWSNFYNNIQTNMTTRAAFYYVNDGSSYVQVVTREFTWDYANYDQNWYNQFVQGSGDHKYKVNFGNFSYAGSNVVGGSVSDIGQGTYANPSPTPGGTGTAHTGKPYNIAKFT